MIREIGCGVRITGSSCYWEATEARSSDGEMVYSETATPRSDYRLYKELLEKANGHCHFVQDYKLMMIFESVEKHLDRA